MSVVRCEKCPALIDTDRDTECEVYVGNYRRLHFTEMRCQSCRDEIAEYEDYLDGLAAHMEMAL